jgi:hypothetical protein
LTLFCSFAGGALAQLSITPSPLAFGSQGINVASSAQTVTITNTGTTTVTVTGLSFSGTGAGAFAFAPITFPVSLAAGASLPVSITFTPTGPGDVSAILNISTTEIGTQTLNLTGTGTLPSGVSLTSSSLVFLDQAVGSSSPPQQVTVCNTGTSALGISSVSVTGDFVITDTGGAGLATGACRTITVVFRPTAAGLRTGTLTIVTSSGTAAVSLTGNGVAGPVSGPFPSLIVADKRGIFFPATSLCGTSSKPRGLDVLNIGGGPLTISNFTISGPAAGDFQVVESCSGTAIGSMRPCRIFVLFTPTAVGSRVATLTINSNSAGGPVSLPLVGTGRGAGLAVSPSNLTFNQAVGTVTSQTITLTNPGTTPITVSTVTLTGPGAADFTLSPVTVPLVVAPGGTQTLTVSYGTKTPGVSTASVVLGTGPCPSVVSLTGTSTLAPGPGPAAPAVAISPSPLTFSQTVGTTSGAQTVYITNVGNAPLTISNLAFMGAPAGFAFTSVALPTTLAPGVSLPLSVTFTPAAGGDVTATLSVTSNAADSPESINLAGTGTAATGSTPAVAFTPSSPTFGPVPVGSDSVQVITLRNTQSATLGITGISISGANSGDFAVVSSTGATGLAQGASLSITVRFRPTAAGTRAASLDVATTAGTQSVPLTGTAF